MAVRLNPKHDERTRSKIQTSQLCNRLNLFALGLPDPGSPNGKPVEMSDTQVRAALGLLRKTLPDLAVTTIEGSVEVTGGIDAPTRPKTIPEWLAVRRADLGDDTSH